MFYLDIAYVLQCFLGVFLQAFQTYVSSISSVFFLYVASAAFGCFKSRSGVAHVAMAIHTYFKRIFQVFICFRRMLQVFHLGVSKEDLEEAHVVVASAPPCVTVPPWVTARTC
jgi:hypothetical protein